MNHNTLLNVPYLPGKNVYFAVVGEKVYLKAVRLSCLIMLLKYIFDDFFLVFLSVIEITDYNYLFLQFISASCILKLRY